MKSAIQKIDRIVVKIDNICAVISALFISAMVILVFIEIVMRNLFNSSTLIADEYAGYFLVGSLFFGVAYTFRVDGFIRVDMFYRKFRGRAKYILDIILLAIALVYAFVLFKYIAEFVMQSYSFGTQSTYYSKTPLFIPQGFMVIGMIVFIIEILSNLLSHIVHGIDEPNVADLPEGEGVSEA